MTLSQKPLRSVIACCLIGAVLSGCARQDAPLAMNDPIEPFNRKVHAFNKAVDQAVLRPVTASQGGTGEVGERLGDFADNLGKPADIVNNVLQLRLVKASENLLRFGMNTVFGVGGLFDVASAAEISLAVDCSLGSQFSSSRSAGAEIDSPATSLLWSS